MQSKTASKFVISILLVAAVLLTYCFGCTFSVAYADSNVETQAGTHTVTYKWAVEDGAYQTKSTQSVQYAYALTFPTMEEVKWFKFDGWYTDAARTTKASAIINVESDLTLYGAYVFNVGTGDVNADGHVNIDDISLYRKYIVSGYGMQIVPSGSEWDIVKSGGSYSDSTTYFLERVADISDSGVTDIRELTQIRMAIVGGYGIDVYDQGISSSDTVYYYDFDNCQNPHVYAWNSDGNIHAWPGIPMVAVDGHSGWYMASIPSGMNGVIFNNITTSFQTVDLTFDASKPYFCCGTWYRDFTDMVTVYYHNDKNWEQLYAYHWIEGGDNNGWPGALMTPVANRYGWYSIDIPCDREKIIFNKGTGGTGNQTRNIDLEYGNSYFYNDSWHQKMTTTIYYYNTDVALPHAYYWLNQNYTDHYDYAWPGTPMTPVDKEPGLFSIEVPLNMTKILFTDGSGNLVGDQTINRTYPYFNDGWKKHHCIRLEVDGVNYDMVLHGGDEYMVLGVYLKAGQTVNVTRYGNNSRFNSSFGFSGTVTQDGYYDFYCKSDETWVNKS